MPILSEITVTFPELIVRAGGKMAFTVDQLERQIDQCDGLGEDFFITVAEDRYRVPIASIRDYFASHKRPMKPMNKDQEIEMLRRRVQDLETSLAADRVKEGPKEFHVEPQVEKAPEVSLEDVIREGQSMQAEDPGAVSGPRESPDQIAARLRRELAGTKPITRDSTVSGGERGGL